MLGRRHLPGLATLLAAPKLAAPATAQAEAWPARPVNIIVPWAAGGGADTVTRIFAQLGQYRANVP
jgi:tripartite-type tricarboxylate transporter receptor subunit TctC